MTERENRTEGDDHEKAWNADTEDVLAEVDTLQRLAGWMVLPVEDEAAVGDDAIDQEDDR